MATFKQIINKILIIVYTLLLIFLAIMIIKKIIYGGSDTLIIGLLLANLGYSFYINTQLQRLIGEFEGYKKGVKNGLAKTKKR